MPGKRFISVATVCAVFVLSLMAMIGLSIRHNRYGREVSRLTSQKMALIEQNRHYRAEMDRLTVIADLEEVAASLGLVPPDEGQIVIIP
jgi:hypothetical protein